MKGPRLQSESTHDLAGEPRGMSPERACRALIRPATAWSWLGQALLAVLAVRSVRVMARRMP